MKNPTTLWNGHSWETLELEDALVRVADGTGQITDIDVGAHRLLTPDEFTKRRSMLAAKKPPKVNSESDKPDPPTKLPLKRGEYQTTDMRAKKP